MVKYFKYFIYIYIHLKQKIQDLSGPYLLLDTMEHIMSIIKQLIRGNFKFRLIKVKNKKKILPWFKIYCMITFYWEEENIQRVKGSDNTGVKVSDHKQCSWHLVPLTSTTLPTLAITNISIIKRLLCFNLYDILIYDKDKFFWNSKIVLF